MKAKYILGTFFCASMALMGCSDDLIEDQNTNTPWQEGDAIIFGARGGFENNEKQTSRTIYNGGTYEVLDENGEPHIFEKIEWVDGDNISIMCDQAHISGNPGAKFVDYVASGSHIGSGIKPESSNYGYTTFAPVNQNSALQWGSPEVEHVFYACYPTTATTSTPNQPNKVGMKIEKSSRGVMLTGIIPNKQTAYRVESVKDYGNDKYTGYIARPIMRNAHMYAKSVQGVRAGETVDLTFKPIPTAIEIELVGGNNEAGTTVLSVMIGSKNPEQKLAGSYKCYIDELGTDGYPTCEIADNNQAGNQVFIPLPATGENGIQGVKLLPGKKLRLTAFLLPHTQLSDLTVTVNTFAGSKTHTITKGTAPVTISAHKKHYVRNVTIPTQYTLDNWMSRIDNNVKLSQLSIPGTSNSYSFSSDKTPAYYKSQTLDIAKQWNMGTRCFEIKSDRNTTILYKYQPLLGGSGEDLSSGFFGKEATVGNAVTKIWEQVKTHKTEFAIIIMNYQPSASRNGVAYLEGFDSFISNINNPWVGGLNLPGFDLQKHLIKYDPETPIRDYRGKLVFIVRPSSFGEAMLPAGVLDSYANKPYLIVDGWGSLQDQWYQRGYPVKANATDLGSNANSAANVFAGSMEQTMIAPTAAGPFNVMKKDKNLTNFSYATNNGGFEVWAQDWNRVSAVDQKFDLTDPTEVVLWKESYLEKLDDAEQTFLKAKNRALSNTLIVNCISGYFIDANTDSPKPARSGKYHHYSGGSYGNIETYSQKINHDFFVFMWDQWQQSITAPMGIVMMNRLGAGNSVDNPENFYMPNIVISNNFSFPLETVE